MNVGFALLPLRKWHHAIGCVIVFTSSLIRPTEAFGQTKSYVVTDLPSEGASEVPSKLNNLGDVAGSAAVSVGGETRATIWNHGTLRAKHLGALPGGEYSSAFAINDAGQVAGASNIGNAIVPFIWKPVVGLKRIPLLLGDKCGQAFGINKKGHAAGYSSGPNGAKAFLWMPRTGIRNLGSLPGGSYSRARGVNDSDEVVGTSASPAGDRAVLWTKAGNIRDLGTLPGDTSSEAIAINNFGEVVGCSKGPGGLRAFLWTQVNGMQDLGVLPGANVSRALDINDLGYVVGSSSNSSSDHAFIWTKQTGMTDLNSAASVGLGVVFVEARAINKAGEIVVMGKNTHLLNADGDMALAEHDECAPAPPLTFLLTPTP
jgi:probable HAF family extracellular repeat protein